MQVKFGSTVHGSTIASINGNNPILGSTQNFSYLPSMKSITFRPLRMVKKTGRITVASYMGWRKVAVANYEQFNLVVDDEYKRFRDSDFVYNHEGELLYWFKYDPWEIPVMEGYSVDVSYEQREMWKLKYGGYGSSYSGTGLVYYIFPGLDCDGVPTFSHVTQDRVADWNNRDVEDFYPLTVGCVKKWLGWFLYGLENSKLKVGK